MNNFNPLDHPICLAYPLRATASTWLTHVPFGMFLIEILQPGIVVELGTYSGVSYCAFCQAVSELGLDSRLFAIDTWQGDPHSGIYGPEVLADLREHHDPLYSNYSELIQSTFAEAVGRFENESIDLLHIDGLHTYQAAREDFESWLPKMSGRGVMLFHDTMVHEGDFGVWKLWKELQTRYPSFEFFHGYGLGVLCVGTKTAEGLRRLLDSSEKESEQIREFFRRLGERLEWKAKEESRIQSFTEPQRRRLNELESFVRALRQNPVFKTYHWVKYLGRRE